MTELIAYPLVKDDFEFTIPECVKLSHTDFSHNNYLREITIPSDCDIDVERIFIFTNIETIHISR